MSNDIFRPELWDRARSAFERSVQRDLFKGRVEKIDEAVKIAKIRYRTDELKEKAQDHYERRYPTLVEREYQKLQMQNAQSFQQEGFGQGPKPPLGHPSKQFLKQQSLITHAQNNVRLKQLRRLESIDRLGKRMTRQITQKQQQRQTRRRAQKR